MTTSERRNLIRGISARLGSEEWSIIDLTLSQFKLPTSESWSGTSERYVLTMLKDSPDEALVTLARHLNMEIESTAPNISPTFWRPGAFRLFLSHLSTESTYASS